MNHEQTNEKIKEHQKAIALLANAAAEKIAFPWLCIRCHEQNRGEPAHRSYWGRVCVKCWEMAKQRSFEEVTVQ